MIPRCDMWGLVVMPQCTNRIDVHTAHLPDLHISAQGEYYTVVVDDPATVATKTIKIHKDGTVELL